MPTSVHPRSRFAAALAALPALSADDIHSIVRDYPTVLLVSMLRLGAFAVPGPMVGLPHLSPGGQNCRHNNLYEMYSRRVLCKYPAFLLTSCAYWYQSDGCKVLHVQCNPCPRDLACLQEFSCRYGGYVSAMVQLLSGISSSDDLGKWAKDRVIEVVLSDEALEIHGRRYKHMKFDSIAIRGADTPPERAMSQLFQALELSDHVFMPILYTHIFPSQHSTITTQHLVCVAALTCNGGLQNLTAKELEGLLKADMEDDFQQSVFNEGRT